LNAVVVGVVHSVSSEVAAETDNCEALAQEIVPIQLSTIGFSHSLAKKRFGSKFSKSFL